MDAIKVRLTRRAGDCCISKDELLRDILQWAPLHGRAKAGQPDRAYIQQLCADTEYSVEDVPGAMDARDGWRESVMEIRAGSVT